MIQIRGSAQRSFRFPASARQALDFYRDAERAVGFLNHVTIDARLGADRYRLAYEATEAALYRVRILCQVRAVTDDAKRSIVIEPVEAAPAAAYARGLNSMTGYGRYASRMRFRAEGERTRVEYALSLEASLPIALSLRFVPRARLAAAADRIMRRRIEEIVQGFVEASVGAFLEQSRASNQR
ncbi:MAG: hypothetical protein JSW68_10930 [Burkholderiales bacterium]|nr:MAG: hypothetical protein JSW68_10930 [Burkholderiales bacterium]